MGAFFTNVQLFTSSFEKKEMHAKTIKILRKYIGSLGFFETKGSDNPDLTVAVSPITAKPWISVFDQGTEDQDTKKILTLLKVLTKDLSCTGVGITVHDSDVLSLILYEKGKLLDSFNSNPLYFGEEISEKEIEKEKGHAEKWRKIIGNGYTTKNLKELFTKERAIFVEDDLYSGYAGIFNWNKEFCTVGYNYLKNIDTRGFSRLKFSLKDKVKLQVKSTGGPIFKNHSHNINMMGVAKFDFNFHFSVYNQGGETKGVRIVLWGPCVEKNMLDDQNLRAEIWMGAIKDDSKLKTDKIFFSSRSRSGKKLLIAEFSDFKVTAGFKQDPYSYDYGQMIAQMDKFYATHVNIKLKGLYAHPGNEKLYIGCVPLENPGKGSTSITIPVDIIDAPPLPLPYVKTKDNNESYGIQMALRQWAIKRTLFAMAIISDLNDDLIELVQTAAEEWFGFMQNHYQGTSPYFFSQSRQKDKFKNCQIPFKEKYGSKEWDILKEAIKNKDNIILELPSYEADVSGTDDFNEKLHNSGFLLSNETITKAFSGSSTPEAKHICFWMDMKAFPKNKEGQTVKLLEGFMEKIMDFPGSLQAFITTWDFSPKSYDLVATPYETVCGMKATGQTCHLSWCSSFLRMVAGRMWIGKPFMEKLSTFADLKQCAEISEKNQCLKIILKSQNTLSDLEKCFQAILPAPENEAVCR
jgi:hypothetical protein